MVPDFKIDNLGAWFRYTTIIIFLRYFHGKLDGIITGFNGVTKDRYFDIPIIIALKICQVVGDTNRGGCAWPCPLGRKPAIYRRYWEGSWPHDVESIRASKFWFWVYNVYTRVTSSN